MKKTLFVATTLFFSLSTTAFAYWIWTPQTGRWINPKYSVKGSPAEQLTFARGLFDAKEYKKAEQEFIKLIHYYRRSKEAAEAQYYRTESSHHLTQSCGARKQFVHGNFPRTLRQEDQKND